LEFRRHESREIIISIVKLSFFDFEIKIEGARNKNEFHDREKSRVRYFCKLLSTSTNAIYNLTISKFYLDASKILYLFIVIHSFSFEIVSSREAAGAEKKYEASRKKALDALKKSGDVETARIYAETAVQNRTAHNQFLIMASRIDSVIAKVTKIFFFRINR
jgi:hypothetical protein